ncbi:MAG: hypothetical protein VYA34_07515, partial [Myxococcota bacterium]|nr:hypothetical protein [Myxococcota bacterium]
MEITPPHKPILEKPITEKVTSKQLMNQCVQQLQLNRKGEARFIALLNEIDHRRLFAEEGYSSMFKFCVGHLHLSEAATYKRIGAGRVIRQYPIALEMLEEGEIHLTAINIIRPCLTSENHLKVLRLCKHKTRVEVELLAAQLSSERSARKKKKKPKAEIRALPSFDFDNLGFDNPQRELSPKPADTSAPAKQNEFKQNDRKEDERGVLKPSLSPRRFRLSVDIEQSIQEKLTRAQELSPFGKSSLQDVLSASLDLLIKERMKMKFKQGSSPHRALSSTQTTKATGRHIPSAIKREVADRDNFQCTFTSSSGHRCKEKQGLEYHHLQ